MQRCSITGWDEMAFYHHECISMYLNFYVYVYDFSYLATNTTYIAKCKMYFSTSHKKFTLLSRKRKLPPGRYFHKDL
jgi:hypothetical protein